MSEPFAALSGRYQLHETLGGSESLVCRGYDLANSRWVAIKTPNDAVRADPKRLRDFLEPARALQTVSSSFVIRIHELIEAGQLDDRPYLVTEWLDTDLAGVMARGALPPDQAERLLQNLTTGLRDLHQAGVLHRDLNPGNILLSQDLAELRIADPGGHQTFTQAAQYSAPELYHPDQVVDARSDLFALGMIAYELLLGPERFREVFAEIYETDEAQHHTCWMNWQLDLSRAAPPLAELNPRIPRYLSDWVASLLAKDPARRCPDAAAALAGLTQEEEPILQPDALPVPPPKRPPPPDKPLWQRPGFIAVVLLVWVILPLGLWWVNHKDPNLVQKDPNLVQIETVLLPEVNQARQAAVAEGAEHPPPVAGLTAGDAAKAEAKAAFDRQDYATSRSRLETARDQFRQARQQAEARNREAEQARDASVARRAEAVQAGGEGLARFREADARHQAGLAALPLKNAPAAQAAFAAAQAGFAAVVAEAQAIQARTRMQAARTAAEQARVQASPDFQRGAALAQEAEGPFQQAAFAVARERYEAAAAAFAQAQGWRPPPPPPPPPTSVTVDLGSTPAELRVAHALCQRYPAPGLDCQAELAGETLRRVTLRPATLDRTEVTRAAFARFVQQTGYRTEAEQRGYSYRWGALGAARANGATWRSGSTALEQDNRPVAHVTRQDALAYCQWAGQRLPSEDEWEYAARGAERQLFPWGAAWDESRAVWNGAVQPAGARPAGATPEGLQDLAGNVWEWTATPAPGGAEGIAKGGSYLGPPLHLRAAARLVIEPGWSFPDLGFRCAK